MMRKRELTPEEERNLGAKAEAILLDQHRSRGGGNCAKCGYPIAPGEEVYDQPEKHLDCRKAIEGLLQAAEIREGEIESALDSERQWIKKLNEGLEKAKS